MPLSPRQVIVGLIAVATGLTLASLHRLRATAALHTYLESNPLVSTA
jgi:hypothetical protein